MLPKHEIAEQQQQHGKPHAMSMCLEACQCKLLQCQQKQAQEPHNATYVCTFSLLFDRMNSTISSSKVHHATAAENRQHYNRGMHRVQTNTRWPQRSLCRQTDKQMHRQIMGKQNLTMVHPLLQPLKPHLQYRCTDTLSIMGIVPCTIVCC